MNNFIAVKDRPLTPKQERFCREYMVDMNGTQAAIRAGYSRRSASEIAAQLLAKLNVKQRVSALTTAVAKRNDVTTDEVIGMLRDSYRDAKKDKQHGPSIRAVELLGKTRGLFVERHIHEIHHIDDNLLINHLAGGDKAVARQLREKLAIDGECEEMDPVS